MKSYLSDNFPFDEFDNLKQTILKRWGISIFFRIPYSSENSGFSMNTRLSSYAVFPPDTTKKVRGQVREFITLALSSGFKNRTLQTRVESEKFHRMILQQIAGFDRRQIIKKNYCGTLLNRISEFIRVDAILFFKVDPTGHLFLQGVSSELDFAFHDHPRELAGSIEEESLLAKQMITRENLLLCDNSHIYVENYLSQLSFSVKAGNNQQDYLITMLSKKMNSFNSDRLRIARSLVAPFEFLARSSETHLENHFLTKSLQTIHEISDELSSSEKRLQLLPSIVRKISSMLHCGDVSILLKEQNPDVLKLAAATGRAKKYIHKVITPEKNSICYSLLKTGTGVRIDNFSSQTRFSKQRILDYQGRSLVVSPMTSKKRLFGVLCITNKTNGDYFSRRELALIDLISATLARYLENRQLFNNLEMAFSKLEQTYDILRKISKTLNTQELLTEFAIWIEQEFGAKWFKVTLWDKYKKKFIESLSHGKGMNALHRLKTIYGTTLDKWLAKRDEPLFIEDAFTFLEIEQPTKNPSLAIIHLPLFHKTNMIGWLNMGFATEKRCFESESFEILKSLAHMLSTYLANSHYYWESEKNVADLEVMQELGKIVTSNLNMKEMNGVLLELLLKLLRAQHAYLFLQKGSELSVLRSRKNSDDRLKETSVTKKWRHLRQVMCEPQLLSHEEFYQKTGILLNRRKKRKGLILYAPLAEKDEIRGFLMLFRDDEKDPFYHSDLEFLTSLSAYTSIAVRNSVRFQAGYSFFISLAMIIWRQIPEKKRHSPDYRKEFLKTLKYIDMPKNDEEDFIETLNRFFPDNPFCVPG